MTGLHQDLLVLDGLHGLVRAAPVATHALEAVPRVLTQEEVFARLGEWAKDFSAGQAPATVRAVRADWAQYMAWCEGTGRPALPADVDQLEAFLRNAIVRGRKLATVRRYLYTVGLVHDAAGIANPANDRRWKNKWKVLLRELRARGAITPAQAGALEAADVRQILARLGDSPRDLRDAALIALASDTLLRESELVAVRVEHFHYNRTRRVWTLHVPFSKANQDGQALDDRYVHAGTMARVRQWMDCAGIDAGFVFLPIGGRPKAPPPAARSLQALPGTDAPVPAAPLPAPVKDPMEPQPLGAQEVARIFRRRAVAAGLEHAATISGHSARVGTANDLINNGATTAQIQHAGGWRSAEMVNRYTRRSQAGVNAVADLRRLTSPADDPESD
ncbi:MAG: hypothetical protein ABT19_02795 [Rhodanobacter sp. SCN 68-63]|nr:MAG: hypothetical protein ABT19_02795 [Rhodanobacter sp. SCN 68-63]